MIRGWRAVGVLSVLPCAVICAACGSADEGSQMVYSGGGYVNADGHVVSIMGDGTGSANKTNVEALRDANGRQIVFTPSSP
ncbi:MAG: hypothetical protein R3E87_23810 [Burkholderiaceae bacterium]